MLRLLLVEPGYNTAVSAGLVEDPLNALVTGAGDLEVDGVDRMRNVEAVILLVQCPAPHSMILMRVFGWQDPNASAAQRESEAR